MAVRGATRQLEEKCVRLDPVVNEERLRQAHLRRAEKYRVCSRRVGKRLLDKAQEAEIRYGRGRL